MQYALTTLALATSALVSTVNAQIYPPYDPNTTALAVREQWCVQQEASCSLLCLNQNSGNQYDNGCDPTSLAFSCICADGSIPNATQYSQTIPYFICQEEVIGCTTACNSVSSCVTLCNDNKHCGASDPVRVNTSTITTQISTAAPSSTANPSDVVYAGFGTTAAAATGTPPASTGSSAGSKPAQTSASSGLGLTSNAVAIGQIYGATVVMLSIVVSTFVFML